MGKALRRKEAARKASTLSAKKAEHEAWLVSKGIKKPGRKARRGLESNFPGKTSYVKDGVPATSDRAISRGTVAVDPEFQKAIEETGKRVAPAYNKGPLTYYGDDLSGIRNSGRGRLYDED